MNLDLGNGYRIVSDAYCYIVQNQVMVTRKKTGLVEPEWKDMGYCRTVNSALKYIVDKELKVGQLDDLKAIIDKIDEIGKLIDEVVPTNLK